MNKKAIILLSTVFALSAVIFSSCSSSDAVSEALLVGLWESADSESSWSDVNFDFNEDGSARMMGYDVDETGEKAEFSWKADGYHLELTDMLLFYSCAYVYELSPDGETLYLYCTAVGMMNSFYDSISPGYHITLNRSDAEYLQDLVTD